MYPTERNPYMQQATARLIATLPFKKIAQEKLTIGAFFLEEFELERIGVTKGLHTRLVQLRDELHWISGLVLDHALSRTARGQRVGRGRRL